MNKLFKEAKKNEFFGCKPKSYHEGMCRRGRLQKTRPLAFTNAAIAKLNPPQNRENTSCQISFRTCFSDNMAKKNPMAINAKARGKEANDSTLFFWLFWSHVSRH